MKHWGNVLHVVCTILFIVGDIMAHTYSILVKLSVRDACGIMGTDGSYEQLDAIASDIIDYCKTLWPETEVKIIGPCD